MYLFKIRLNFTLLANLHQNKYIKGHKGGLGSKNFFIQKLT